ncbi:MAG: tetratricopeptide repeat protein [Burkholderiales bacterium]|nr:tetratricopeptide repeat protein [Burkholderiales bacterium]
MFADRYGLPASTRSREALDAYVAGADGILSADPGWRDALSRALDADPEFALARIALARGLFLDAEAAAARAQAARARASARGASERERSHVHALALSFEAERAEALAAARAHLARWPRDAMVLAPATGVFGLIGFSGRPEREEELYALLASLSPHYGEDWWFDAVYAFAACETGRLAEAARRIERSLAAHPRNAHGAHVRVHVLYEAGETAAIREYLAAWMPGYDRRGLLHCHLSWHAALAALAAGDRDGAWAAYRAAVHPGAAWGPPINVATDAASFLWRAELAGEPRPAALWRDVRDYALRCFPAAGLVFADLHTALACIACGEEGELERLLVELRERLAEGRLAAGPVVEALLEGLAAYGRGDWNGAIAILEPALAATVRIGGSRAQRDLVELTLLAAYVNAGRAEHARSLVERRAGRRAPAGARPRLSA